MNHWKPLALFASLALPLTGAAQGLQVGPVYATNGGEDIQVVVEIREAEPPLANDFVLLEDQAETVNAQSQQRFWESELEMALVFCVDVSGTMRGAPLQEVREALGSFLEKTVHQRHPVALVSFADKATTVVADFTRGPRTGLVQAVQRLSARGNSTVLYDAVAASIGLLEEASVSASFPKRKRVIVISDGKDEGSDLGVEAVTQAAHGAGIRIDGIGRGKIERGFAQGLGRLSDRTGGYFREPPRGRLFDALETLYWQWEDLVPSDHDSSKVNGTLVLRFARERANLEDRLRTETVGVTLNGLLDGPWADSARARILRTLPVPPEEIIVEVDKVVEVEKLVEVDRIIKVEKTNWSLVLWAGAGGLGLAVSLVVYWLSPWSTNIRLPGIKLRLPGKPQPRQSPPDPTTPRPDKPAEPLPSSAAGHGPRVTRIGAYFQPPTPRHPSMVLVGVEGPARAQRFPLQGKSARMGAGADNDWVVTGDEYVSTRHARFRYEAGEVFIQDLQSKNGTHVNHELVTGTRVLNVGDRIRLGESTFEVVPGTVAPDEMSKPGAQGSVPHNPFKCPRTA